MTWDVFGRMAAEGEKLAASKASLTTNLAKMSSEVNFGVDPTP